LSFQPPEKTPEFLAWMNDTFGPENRRWLSLVKAEDGKKVRSGRGAGNRGGWEFKPFYMTFVFLNDADAILFKMAWGHAIIVAKHLNI